MPNDIKINIEIDISQRLPILRLVFTDIDIKRYWFLLYMAVFASQLLTASNSKISL